MSQSANGGGSSSSYGEDGGISEEFGFESSESAGLIADLVKLQLNEWGRKVAALKKKKVKMAAADLVARENPSLALADVDFFTELHSADGKRKPYFRNLTPDDSAAAPQFLNLTPDGYGTNLESRPEASFEEVGSGKLEAYLEDLGKTGK